MELYEEILSEWRRCIKVNAAEIVEIACYRAMQEIKAILENDDLTDAECFMKIEEIVNVFEAIGSGGGTRHDFG